MKDVKRLLEVKFLYLQDCFLSDRLISQQVRHVMDKRNLKNWKLNEQLILTY